MPKKEVDISSTTSTTPAQKKKAYLSLALICLLWGSTWVASKIGVEDVPGLQLSYIRQFFAGCLFLSFFKLKGEPWPTFGQFKWLVVLSLFMIVFANGISTWSIRYIPSGMAALIGTLFPLCVVIIEMVWFRNNPNNKVTIIGMLLGFAGLSIVFYQNLFLHHSPDYIFGVVVSFLSTVSWSIGTILVARKQMHMNPYYSMGWQMLIGSFFIFVMASITGNQIPIGEVPAKGWLAIAYLVMFGSVTAFSALIYTMKHLPAAVASMYGYINPLVALVIGSILIGEKLTVHIVIGSLITLTGVLIVNRSFKKR